MQSYTTRGSANWSISDLIYKKGTYKSETNFNSSGQKLITYATRTAGGNAGATKKTVYGHTIDDSVTKFENVITKIETLAGYENHTPATYSTTYLHITYSNSTRPGSQSVETLTATRDYENNNLIERSAITKNEMTGAETYSSSSQEIAGTGKEKGASGTANWNIVFPEGTTPSLTSSTSKKIYTGSGTSSHTFTRKATAYYKDYTTTYPDGQVSNFYTSSYTVSASVSSDPTSSWRIWVSYQTGQPWTGISSDAESTNAVTYSDADRETYTKMVGTRVSPELTWPYTAAGVSWLKDTVVLMNANRGTDFNLGGILWVFSLTNLEVSASTTGLFSDIFSSRSGAQIIIGEFSKFETFSSVVSGIAISVGTAEETDSMGSSQTYIGSRTSYDGVYFPSSTRSSSYKTGTATGTAGSSQTSTRKSLVQPDFFTTGVHTFDLAEVYASQSTYFTETDHTAPRASITIYTHLNYRSTYRQSDSSWITEAFTENWVSSISSTFRRDQRYKAATKTHLVSYRSTIQDEILISKFYITGEITSVYVDFTGGTRGIGTEAYYLGMQKATSVRVITKERRATISTYDGDLHEYLSQYTSTGSGDGKSTASGGGATATGGGTVTGTATGGGTTADNETGMTGYTYIYADAVNVTLYTEQRLQPLIEKLAVNVKFGNGNRVLYRALPIGWAGFGGTFNPAGVNVWRNTTQGLAAGSTFHTSQSIDFPYFVSAVQDVAMLPAVSLVEAYGGHRFKVISPPSGLSAVMSVAATWVSAMSTSRNGLGTTTTLTSAFATHTLSAVDPIKGNFWKEELLKIDNSFRVVDGLYGSFHGSVGFGLGQNVLRQSYQVILDAGYVEWTEYSSQQSEGGIGRSSSGSNGTVSFSVPHDRAIVFRAEDIFSVSWGYGSDATNHFFSTPYNPDEQ